MAHFSKSLCQAQLTRYLDAEKVVLTGQSYTIGGRSLTRANLTEIRKGVDYWAEKLDEAEQIAATGRRGPFMRRVIPHG